MGIVVGTIAPELRAEIAMHVRASSGSRHSLVLRGMERGLSVEQMAASQHTTVDNVKAYVRGIEALLDGRLPTTPSSALDASRVYRLLLACSLSLELRDYVTTCLGRLAAINPSIAVNESLRPSTLRDAETAQRRVATVDPVCPSCFMNHAGECLG